MKHSTMKILATHVALAVVAASTLLVVGFLIDGPAPSAFALDISSVSDYSVPGSFPWGTTFDRSGRVWVALPGCDLAPSCPSSTPPGKLALFDPKTQSWVTIVSLPAGYGQPLFVAVDQTGNVWFTMPVTNTIGLYDPTSTTLAQWAVPTPSAGPWDIAIDSEGTIWFTEHYVNQIGSFDPIWQTFHEVATPASNSQPYGITVDASNNIWFTENTDSVALIGEYTNEGVLKEYKIRTTPTGGTGLTPHLITVDPHGNIWWSEGWVTAIGRLNVADAEPGTNDGVTEYAYRGTHTSGIIADKQGLIWLDDSLQNTFGSFPIGGGSFSFYNIPSTGGHPHDGLNVDAENHVWFDEEFANKLAQANPYGSPTPTPTSTPKLTPMPKLTATPTPGATLTAQLVTPKTASGSSGKGLQVISTPTPVPGGRPGSQQIILGDRTLIIKSVSKQQGASTNVTLINLDLTVQNTSDKAIMNQSTFFQLMGSEGDTFGYQYNSSDTFYGPIAAHMARNGTIMFQVPTAATAGLRLLYRPELATETAIIWLNIL